MFGRRDVARWTGDHKSQRPLRGMGGARHPKAAASHCCVPVGACTPGPARRTRYLLPLPDAGFLRRFIDLLIHSTVACLRIHLLEVV